MTLDDLYGLPQEDFIAARRDLARQARTGGDPEGAAAIEKLAKPTKAAWLVNRLVREHPDEIATLTDLGDDLRAAHTGAAGESLRELTQRRTTLIRELVGLAGKSLSESITREIEEMLTAAIADSGAGEVLRTGRVSSVRDLSIASAWPGLEIAAVPRPKPAAKPAPVKVDAAKARREALAAAKAQVKAAEADRAAAEKTIEKTENAVAAAEKEVRDLNQALDAAEVAEMEARRALQVARRDAKDAERAAGLAWRKLQQAEDA
ncbi:hypothetical protein [Alloactinosynnema sp. L-07]|uniref:hypothetical protein n=1 Tax=Alloactinosynnema sp. L-07 TaxID=1653480 RepID=UPI0012F76A86|nr:hypothetical protein [Alloactinosynnema sp. L-07]